MSSFQLDTSGHVFNPLFRLYHEETYPAYRKWSDLSPFTRGYIEALLQPREAFHYSLSDRFAGFSDLAPDTLARIIEDCERLTAPETHTFENSADVGRYCWEMRKAGWPASTGGPVLREDFPPITPYLGDDGAVYLRDA